MRVSWVQLTSALGSYTTGQTAFDPAFSAEIRKFWPSRYSRSAATKAVLLDIARKMGPKPHPGSKLYNAFHRFTTSGESFDPVFTVEIRKFWPRRSSAANKENLLAIARSGASRPTVNVQLGRALQNYTTRSCRSFDPAFTAEIRKHWLPRRAA